MSEYLRAAKAVLKAQMDRENSWDGEKYTLSCANVYNKAYQEYKLSDNLLNLLYCIDYYYWTEIHEWAENVVDSELGKLPER